MRQALIDGGGAAHRGLQAPGRPFAGLEPIPLERLAQTELSVFDVVVVPRSCDADRLFARRHQIRRYLDCGGVLISFGELLTDWLPGARWEAERPVDVERPPTVTNHPLLAGFGADELWWHRGPQNWCCHGHVNTSVGAEILVANADGQAWLYVDRVSTAGTIVSGSNLDLDTHAFHGDASAEVLLGRLLEWAAAEADRTAELRATPSTRVAYAYSGVHFQRGLLDGPIGRHFATVPVEELGGIDLATYAGLWIPRESDQRALHARRDRIAGYVADGGHVIVLEELDRDWLPGISWRPASIDLTDLRMTAHPLVEALEPFESPWHGHGVVDLPTGAEILIGTPDGGALLGTFEIGSGRVLAGTIDADAHAGYGSTLPASFVEAAVAWLRVGDRTPIVAG